VSDHDPREDYDDEPWRGRAVKGRLINLPADLMWSCAWFQIAVSLYALLSATTIAVQALSGRQAANNPVLASVICLAVGIVGLVHNWLVVRGAKAMRRGTDYPRAVLAACLTVASVPCVASFPYTVPLGIWALIVLNRPDVRAHFRGRSSAAGPSPGRRSRFRADA
jgi:hypothetical protein